MVYMCQYLFTDTLKCLAQLMDANNDQSWGFYQEKQMNDDKDPC